MEKVTLKILPFNYSKEKEIFQKTFKCIYEADGKNAFSSVINLEENKFKSDIIMYFYDSFTCGIAQCEDILEEKTPEAIKKTLNSLRKNTDFLKTRTGGKRNTEERIALVENTIRDC